MSTAVVGTSPVPWWKEPTKGQWLTWVVAWLGWTLDAFDFTIFLLLMVPIFQGLRRAADRGRHRLHPDLVDALYNSIGWRGLLLIGVLSALLIVYVRKYVKEPEVWVENRRKQREQNREFHVPLLSIFEWEVLANTLTACWMMASAFVVGYSVGGMFPSYLQKDLGLPTGFVALPIMLQSLMFFLSAILWGWCADRFGRRRTRSSSPPWRRSGRAALSADHELHDDRGVLHLARLVRRRRHAHAVAALSARERFPDRGAGDRHRILLPPGAILAVWLDRCCPILLSSGTWDSPCR